MMTTLVALLVLVILFAVFGAVAPLDGVRRECGGCDRGSGDSACDSCLELPEAQGAGGKDGAMGDGEW
ncbi:MAG: hypothetical protein ACE5GJ_13525 [Gemmatimonadota bacterium]